MKRKNHSCQTVHDFFDAFSLTDAQRLLRQAMLAAERDAVWNKSTPADLLYFFERLEVLVDWVLVEGVNNRYLPQVVLPAAAADIAEPELYFGGRAFPRNLDEKSFRDPYRVFRKAARFAGRKEWSDILKELLHYALSGNSIAGSGAEMRVVKIWWVLMRVVDGVYLVNLRVGRGE